MPYVICAQCALRTYSAALWAATDVCPRCGSDLPRPAGKVLSLSEHPGFRSAREHGVPRWVGRGQEGGHA